MIVIPNIHLETGDPQVRHDQLLLFIFTLQIKTMRSLRLAVFLARTHGFLAVNLDTHTQVPSFHFWQWVLVLGFLLLILLWTGTFVVNSKVLGPN